MPDGDILGSRSNEPGLRFGITIAIISAVSFGVVPTFAKLSFAIVRALALSTTALLPIVLLKRDWRVPRAGVAPVLGERLTLAQLSGASLVFTAILLGARK